MGHSAYTKAEFEAVYEEYVDALFRYALLRVSNRERAIELTQDAFMKVWDSIDGGNKVRDYRALLYRTLRNLIIDEYRKKKDVSLEVHTLGTQDDAEQLKVQDILPDESISSPEDASHERMRREALIEALRSLTDSQRELITLRHINGLGVKAIAQMLDETQNVISVRLNRAMQALKLALSDNKVVQ